MNNLIKDLGNQAMNGHFTGRLSELMQRLPGGDFARQQVESIETRMLLELRQRLNALEPDVTESSRGRSRGSASPAEQFRSLLARSAAQKNPQAAEEAYFNWALRQMIPDHARILSALSDRATYPLIDVVSTSKLVVGASRVELSGVCSVGKNAGVQCPQLTHLYVQHLCRLGLAEVDPQVGDDTMRYQMLETETIVRETLDRIKHGGRRGHLVRQTLKMSALGDRLWSVCGMDEDE